MCVFLLFLPTKNIFFFQGCLLPMVKPCYIVIPCAGMAGTHWLLTWHVRLGMVLEKNTFSTLGMTHTKEDVQMHK